eukprot:COSAG01_NODE_1548_length_9950_cov_29.480865_3_plen_820_part_00
MHASSTSSERQPLLAQNTQSATQSNTSAITSFGCRFCENHVHASAAALLVPIVLTLTSFSLIPVFYGSSRAGGPSGFGVSNFPVGLDYVVQPVVLSFLWIHGFWGMEKTSNAEHDLESGPSSRLGRYEKWATSSWISQVFCCARTNDTSEQDQQLVLAALPSKLLILHFLGIYSLLLALGNKPQMYEGASVLAALRAGILNTERLDIVMAVLSTHLVALWALVQLRKGALGVCSGRAMLSEFCSRMRRFVGLAICIQIYVMFCFVQWYYRTLPARTAAIDNGSGVAGGALQEQLYALGFSIYVPMMNVIFFAVWYAIGSGLNMFKTNKSSTVQFILVCWIGLTSLYGFVWARSEMLVGEAMFQFPDGSPCNAECTFTNRQSDSTMWLISLGELSGGNPSWAQYWILLLIPVFMMLGNDVRQQKNFNRKLQLPMKKKYHFFICHHQGSGGNQARILCDQLKGLGCKVWYDLDQPLHERNLDGMKRGVRHSVTLLIFLSGRKERDGQPDVNGQYEGPFTRWFCHEEMGTALEENLHIVGVMETDPRFGIPDFQLERQRALTGRDGRPVSVRAPQHVKLLDSICFIPRRTQEHELKGYLSEIIKQGIEGAKNRQFRAETILSSVEEPSVPWHKGQETTDVLQEMSQALSTIFNRDLPPGKVFHFCICSHMSPSQRIDQAGVLQRQLQAIGFKVIYMPTASICSQTQDQLETAVRDSICLLLFLGGGWNDNKDKYAGILSSHACHEQIQIAKVADLTFVGVMDATESTTVSFAREKQSCIRGKEENLHLLDQLCFIPMRKETHELEGFLTEVVEQGLSYSQVS